MPSRLYCEGGVSWGSSVGMLEVMQGYVWKGAMDLESVYNAGREAMVLVVCREGMGDSRHRRQG